MAPKRTSISFISVLLYVALNSYGLVVHFLTSLADRVHSTFQHIWLKVTAVILQPFRLSNRLWASVGNHATSLCPWTGQELTSSFPSRLASLAVVAARVPRTVTRYFPSQAIATARSAAWHLCCTAIILPRHCILAMSKLPQTLVSAFLDACSYTVLAAWQILQPFVPEDLTCTVIAVLKVLQFLWHKLLDDSGLDTQSADVASDSNLASGKQTVMSPQAPFKKAATYNLSASCYAHQFGQADVVKVAQLASLGWDQKTRSKWASITGKECFEGFWDMVPCSFNAAYRQLAPHYPEELSLIGRGGMGTVFYAETEDVCGKWIPCAVKCQPYQESHIKDVVDREVTVTKVMMGSAHALSFLSENTALLDGKFHHYMATRYLETVGMDAIFSADLAAASGEQLDKALATILVAFEGMVQGVKDLHDAGWAHLDIKPDNLCMVMHPSTAQVHSYVIDYGSCHLQGADVEHLQSTWNYAAPEVLEYMLQPDNDELFWKISFQVQDCWSLGCVLVWLLTGTDPFTVYDEEYRELGLQSNSEYQKTLRTKQAAWYKKQKGSAKAVVSPPLQKLIKLENSKDNALLSGLVDLAAHLLTHRRSTRCTATQALEQLRQLAAMGQKLQ